MSFKDISPIFGKVTCLKVNVELIHSKLFIKKRITG